MIRLLILLLALPINGLACTCSNFGGPVTIKDYNSNEIIISGKAIKVTENRNESVDRQRQITFQIDEVYKGEIDHKTISIYTPLSDASCGLFVKENEEWVIWAYLRNNIIVTNVCTRSQLKEDVSEHDIKYLNYFKSNPSTTEWKDESGNLIAVGNLKNNIPVGYWKYFFPTSEYIESEGCYEKGKYEGKWIIYHAPESIVTRLQYDNKIPQNSIPDLQLFQNKIREIKNYKDGIRDGEYIYYAPYSIDKPTQIRNYKSGKLDGKSIAYFDNGMINYEQNYKEGKLDGYERIYYSNGQL